MENTIEIKEFIKANQYSTGIYALICKINDRKYIGSAIKIGKRVKAHFIDLRKGRHQNTDLQNDFSEFGINNFYAEVIEECESMNLLIRESLYINESINLYNKVQITNNIDFDSLDKEWFWSQIDKSGDCWNWMATLDKGYGRFYIHSKPVFAHRVAFYLINQDIPKEYHIRHKCSNRACCNPHHLEIGCPHHNITDTLSGGQRFYKLNWDIVEFIRERGALHIPNKLILEEVKRNFNVELQIDHISKILLNKIWIYEDYDGRQTNHGPVKLNWELVKQIRDITKDVSIRKGVKVIKDVLGINIEEHHLHDLLKNKIWKDENYIPRQNKKTLTFEDATLIRKMCADGYTPKEIAEKLDVKLPRIYPVLYNTVHTDPNYIPIKLRDIS